MKIRSSAPAVLIATVVFVLAVTGIAQHRMADGVIESVEAARFDLMRRIVVNGLSDAESRALARAELVASLPHLQELLRAGDREAMYDETREMFAIQRDRFGVDQSQFFVLPTHSFLRINAPEKFGDDVSSFRPTVVHALKTKQSIKGLSISRSGPAVFGIAPVRDAEGEIGAFEFGLDFAAILDGIKAKYGFDCAVFLEEKLLREIATGMPGDVMTDSNRVGKYMRVHTTHLDRMKELVTDREVAGGERMLVREAAGVPHGVLVLPLTNFSGKQLGMIAVAGDFSGSRAAAAQGVVWQLLLLLCGAVLSAATILVVIRGMVLRPLREIAGRVHAVARGEAAPPIAGSDEMCEEMQDIAAAVDRLGKSGDV